MQTLTTRPVLNLEDRSRLERKKLDMEVLFFEWLFPTANRLSDHADMSVHHFKIPHIQRSVNLLFFVLQPVILYTHHITKNSVYVLFSFLFFFFIPPYRVSQFTQ